MNVIFHVVTGTAVAAVFSRASESSDTKPFQIQPLKWAGVFCAGILIHGLIDWAPHQYPLRAIPDIAVSVAFMGLCMALVRPRWIPLLAVAYIGSTLPDIVDLGPQMFNRAFGTDLPAFTQKVSPWHQPEYSGSIFDGSRAALSHSLHGLAVALSVFLCWRCGRFFWREKLVGTKK